MMRIDRTQLLAAAAAALVAAGGARAQTLVVAVPGGAGDAGFTRVVSRVVVPHYTAATHARVQVTALPPIGGKPAWDLAALPPAAVAAGCADGSLVKINWAAVGGRQRFLPQATGDCGAGAYLRATVLTWNLAKVPGTPSWRDFWDVARLPGQRALQRTPVGTLEIALMADGVAPGDVYATLGKKDGVNRAFRKLDQLRPYIVWWQRDTEPMAIMAAGHVLMSSAPSDQVAAAMKRLHRPFGVQWGGAVVAAQSWAVRAGSTQAKAAFGLIAAASDPAVQVQMTTATGLGAAVQLDAKALPPDVAAAAPTAHLKGTVPFDGGFWKDNGAKLTARFNDWLKH